MPTPSSARPPGPAGQGQPVRADARRNRARIIAAARQIVASEGVAAQIQDVARRAGVGVGTVYRHFPTKEVLMSELVRACMLENLELARSCLDLAEPWAGFDRLVRTTCQRMVDDASIRRAWFATDAEVMAHVADVDQELGAVLAEMIERAHRVGALRDDFGAADMPMLMRSLAGMLEVLPTDPPARDEWPRMVEIVLRGLRKSLPDAGV